MPNDFFINIRDPHDPNGPHIQAKIPHLVFLNLYKYHPVRYENLRAAKFVLENTARIFAGVREFSEGGWCFTGKPLNWYIRETVTAPFPQSLVYAVYINPRVEVYETRAENSAPDDPLCPEGWQNRYSGLIWKSTF